MIFFQMFECTNPGCRLRFPSNLSVVKVELCPFCSSPMRQVGEPFSNSQNSSAHESNGLRISLILDNLRSAQNVGSIFRSADGAGIDHIYCCGTTPTPKHLKVRKSSLGAEEKVPWSFHFNTLDLTSELKREEYQVIALERTSQSKSLFDFIFENSSITHIVIVIGNEIAGVDPEVLLLANQILHLPMAGTKSSLNAAVATGITIYYLKYAQLATKKR